MVATNRDDWDSHWKEYSEGASFNPAQEYRRRLIVKLLGLSGSGSGRPAAGHRQRTGGLGRRNPHRFSGGRDYGIGTQSQWGRNFQVESA